MKFFNFNYDFFETDFFGLSNEQLYFREKLGTDLYQAITAKML